MPRSSNGETRKSCNRGHWRPAEDERLKQLVEQYGPQNWNFIAEHLDGRSGKSCRLRWYNQLDPNIVKRPFTEEEEEMLLSLHKVKGNKWAAISRFLPGRTDNAVKNHFHVLMARRKRDHFTLFGERRSHEIPNNHIPISNPNPMKNFKSQDTRNMSIFGMSSSHSLLSSITSEVVSFEASNNNNKAQNNDFSSASSSHGSCMLSSYNSFTAPGIPSIGKVVPLPYNRFSSSSSNSTFNYYNGQRIEDSSNSNQSKKLGEKHFLAFSELPNKEEGQGERLNGGSSNNVSFIDFLGVGI